ncbi:cell division protein FtsX [Parvularcula dongshanensis]|uniref:Cell division transport system permease protein n=1 Tax=Parvularcula dongshanensis TaxID=1173995 RepID=A0A840I3H1_9PROT|nr:hypothetical protein [Parvularcula dongshanensis]MBB4658590.1 cell division transport system permease protein [Parvularcula dongshanensis]
MSDTQRTGRPVRPTPLLPEAGAAGAPLTIVVAILAFMASLALIGNLVVDRAVEDWTSELTGTVTVQIPGEEPAAIDQKAEAVVGLLEQTDGVIGVTRLDRAETEALLSPWFGAGGLPDDIPVPALVSAEVTAALRSDLKPLRAQLTTTAPDAVLDDHGTFNDRLVAAATRLASLAFLVFAMVIGAAAAVIIFAARAGLAANRSIIEVLHLVGATDGFVAHQVQRRYFSLGLRGGVAGAVVAALVLFFAASFGGGGDGVFLPRLGADPALIAWLAIVPLILCAVAAVSARVTVLRTLRSF